MAPSLQGSSEVPKREGEHPYRALGRPLEATLVVCLFSAYIHQLLDRPATIASLGATFAIAVTGVGIARSPFGRRHLDPHGLWAGLLGIAGGFWVFVTLCKIGLAEWPLQGAATTAQYLRLLYMHILLAVAMIAAVLWTSNWHWGGPHLLRWGTWRARGRLPWGMLLISAIAAWAWTLAQVSHIPFRATGSVWVFLGIAFLKACLTSATEEACYRGVILPAARERFGTTTAIVLQALLFGAFHLFLTPMFADSLLFAGSVVALGIVLGAVTHLTSGIGWAFVAHAAIDMVIEWQNIFTSS